MNIMATKVKDKEYEEYLKAQKARIKKKEIASRNGSEWYNLRPVLGCANFALFYFLIGGREAG